MFRGPLESHSHNVSGQLWTGGSEDTSIQLRNFYYDGTGPGACVGVHRNNNNNRVFHYNYEYHYVSIIQL